VVPAKRDQNYIFRALGCELEDYLEQHGLVELMKEANRKAGGSKQRVARYCIEHIDEDKIP